MITKAMLQEWREANVLAHRSFNTEPEVLIAMKEMYIEAKQLRKDNLKLLNWQDLHDKLLEYVCMSHKDHYLTEEMEDALEEIREMCDQLNIDLERDYGK